MKIVDRDYGDVTVANAAIISRVNPYYALGGGRPLPIVLLEESADGQVARAWFTRWLRASTQEQIEFCGAGLFWSPP